MEKPGCLAFGCFRTVWFHAVLGFASACFAQEAGKSSKTSSLNRVLQKELEEEIIPNVARVLSDFFGGTKSSTQSPSVPSSRVPPPPQPTPPRQPPEDRDRTQDAGDNAAGTVETVGPVRFVVPKGWVVTQRWADDGAGGTGLSLGTGGAGSYLTVQRHARLPNTAYTPEGIGRFIIRFSWQQATTGSIAVGKENLSGFWMAGSGGLEAALFSYGGQVYMVSASSARDAFRELLQSIELGDTVARLPKAEPRFGQRPEQNPPVVGDTDVFAKARDFTRHWEGGYVNDPADAGGATNFGVTQRTYDRFRKEWGQSAQDVRNITAEDVSMIYQSYWKTSGAGGLPLPLSVVHFDTFFHFNPQRAERWKNEVLKTYPNDPVAAAKAYVEKRIAFRHELVKKAPTQKKFLKGWLNRDNDLMKLVTDGAK